jgi:O-antigen ligase
MIQSQRSSIFSQIALVALWAFIFSMPSEKAIQIPGIGSLSRAAGLLAMATGLMTVVFEQRFRVPTITHVLLGVFVLWTAVSYRWSIGPDRTLERITTNVQLLAIPFLIWNVCGSERRCLALMDAYVVGTLFPAIQTLQRFFSGTQTYYQRYALEGFDPNDLALTLALSLPLAYYLSLRRPKLRIAYAGFMLSVCGTIFLTASRGGTVAMAVALSFIVLTLNRLPRTQKIALVVTTMVAAFGATVVIPAASWSRLLTLGSEITQGTLNSRSLLWAEGWRALQNVPFQGVGAGAYPTAMMMAFGQPWIFVPVAHNSFISVLVETGVVGLSLFVGTLTILALMAARLPWLERCLWLIMLAVWVIGVSALTWEYRKPTWFLFGLLIAHVALHMKHRPAVRQAVLRTDFIPTQGVTA